MSPDLTTLLTELFPGDLYAGIRHRCFLAVQMGYSVVMVGTWITMGMPYDKRTSWTAENVPRLAELDRRLKG